MNSITLTSLMGIVLLAVTSPSPLFSQEKPALSPEKQQALHDLKAALYSSTSIDQHGIVRQIRMTTTTPEKIEKLVALCPQLTDLHLYGFRTTEPQTIQIINQLQQLTQLETLTLGVRLTDESAKAVSQFKGLHDLDLYLGHLSPEGITSLGRLSELESLSLNLEAGQDALGAQILGLYPNLTKLSLSDKGVADQTMQAMGALTELKSLSFYVVPNVNERSFSHIRNLKNLEMLEFSIRSGPGWFEHLSELKSLKWLRASYPRASDADIRQLSELTNLERFELYGGQISDQSLAALQKMSKLRVLQFTSPNITGSGFKHLDQLDRLERLILHQTGFQPQHVHHLAQLERLNYLDLSWTPVEKKDGWKSLASLKDLKHLETVWIELQPDEYDEILKSLPGVAVEYYD